MIKVVGDINLQFYWDGVDFERDDMWTDLIKHEDTLEYISFHIFLENTNKHDKYLLIDTNTSTSSRGRGPGHMQLWQDQVND